MDTISIRDLRVETHVGVTKAERARTQTIVISVEIEANLSEAGKSDNIADTVDYDTVATSVADLIRSSETSLLEHLAHKVGELVLTYDRVEGVTVEISKERPPIDEDVGTVIVSVERPEA